MNPGALKNNPKDDFQHYLPITCAQFIAQFRGARLVG